jgi:hypothetical protein
VTSFNGQNITIGFADNADYAAAITSISYSFNGGTPYTTSLDAWEISSNTLRMPAGYYQPGTWVFTIKAEGYEDATLTVNATVPVYP